MRALRIHGFGGPQVMRIDEVPPPQPGAGDILVRVHAASVNPIDWKMREGLMQVPLPRTLGRDGAGMADGRRVVGIGSPGRDGTHAEFAVLPAAACAEIPAGVSFEEAAAVGIAGLSAWIALVENASVRTGQRVLVHAGAGGVGSLAIQIARAHGAEVWTTCSARNSDWCRALGAQHTVDYTRQDFSAAGRVFDLVLDTVGGEVHAKSAEVLKPGGMLCWLNAAPRHAVARTDVKVLATEVRASGERLGALLGLLVSKEIRAPIEARFALERGVEAYELSRGGHARGKIILQMS